jgi:hypothetical protein
MVNLRQKRKPAIKEPEESDDEDLDLDEGTNGGKQRAKGAGGGPLECDDELNNLIRPILESLSDYTVSRGGE